MGFLVLEGVVCWCGVFWDLSGGGEIGGVFSFGLGFFGLVLFFKVTVRIRVSECLTKTCRDSLACHLCRLNSNE